MSAAAGTTAHTWRVELSEDAPQVVAYGLRALGDEGSWQLRYRLKTVAPHFIAKSLSGLAVQGDRALGFGHGLR